MASAVDTSFILGYGGFAYIRFYYIENPPSEYIFMPMISASVQRSNEVQFMSTYNIPFSEQPRSKIRLNTGLYRFTGNITFELTKNLLQEIFSPAKSKSESSKFFSRICFFDLCLCDGQKIILLNQCVWNSFTLSCTPSNPIQCTINFQSTNKFKETIQIVSKSDVSLPRELNSGDGMQEYWKYGNSDGDFGEVIQSFSLSFSRNVTPIYLNNQLTTPTYLKVGALDCNATVSCSQDWLDYSTLLLNTRKITFEGYYKQKQNWQFTGVTGTGMKTYIIKGTNESTKQVFTISKR